MRPEFASLLTYCLDLLVRVCVRFLSNASWTQVRPILLDPIQALVPRSLYAYVSPSVRNRSPDRPNRMLLFLIHHDTIPAGGSVFGHASRSIKSLVIWVQQRLAR
jgi:hypothetical protein